MRFGSAGIGAGGYADADWLARYTKPGEPGEIITFYSYKGGTGRTMALANCAGLMAEHWPVEAKPMLLIDFDLEAPGLHQYLREHLPLGCEPADIPGTLELFEALYRAVQSSVELLPLDQEQRRLDDVACQALIDAVDLQPYLIHTQLRAVHLLTAGRFDTTYAQRLAAMNWVGLFAAAPGLFRALAARLAREYAVTLIDARTGLSDTSGICTMLLPDVLTVVFTPNRQSLAGVEHLVREAKKYRDASSDLRPLRVYPLPSRVEQTSEDYRKVWQLGSSQHPTFGMVEGYQPMFTRLLGETCAGNVTPTALRDGLDTYFNAVIVPHSPDYAYGERLCFGPQTAKDRLSLRSAFEAFLPWLTSGAAPWESPPARLGAVLLEQWLDALEPPAEGESAPFGAWLVRVADSMATISPAGALTQAVLTQHSDDDATTPVEANLVAPLVPQLVLLKGLHWMQGKQWQPAGECFTRGMAAVQEYGLPHTWVSLPRRWLQHHTAVPQGREFVQPWLLSPAADALRLWLDAADIGRAEKWPWLRSVIDAYENCAPTDARRKALAKALLEQQIAALGEEHPDTLTSMNNLADTLGAMGELSAARTMQERVLEVRRREQGEEHPHTLSSMNNLAETLRAMGELPATRTMHERVLEVCRRVLGKEHPVTLTSMNNLALTLQAMGELPTARAMQERVLEVRRHVLGEEHPHTLSSMNNLAETLRAMGELPAARIMHERVLEVCRRVLGEEHPDTLTSMNNLAETLRAMGELPAARIMHERVLEVCRRVLGEEHPDTLTSMSNLASTLLAMSELPAARVLQEQVLNGRLKVLGAEHRDTLASLSTLFLAAQDAKDSTTVSTLFERYPTLVRKLFNAGNTSSAPPLKK